MLSLFDLDLQTIKALKNGTPTERMGVARKNGINVFGVPLIEKENVVCQSCEHIRVRKETKKETHYVCKYHLELGAKDATVMASWPAYKKFK